MIKYQHPLKITLEKGFYHFPKRFLKICESNLICSVYTRKEDRAWREEVTVSRSQKAVASWEEEGLGKALGWLVWEELSETGEEVIGKGELNLVPVLTPASAH